MVYKFVVALVSVAWFSAVLMLPSSFFSVPN